jgi:hypothetical protein
MLARDDELRVGERECFDLPSIGRVYGAQVVSDSARGIGIARAMSVAQLLCLFLVLLEVRTGRQIASLPPPPTRIDIAALTVPAR